MELRSRMVSANGRRYRICQRLPLSIFAQAFPSTMPLSKSQVAGHLGVANNPNVSSAAQKSSRQAVLNASSGPRPVVGGLLGVSVNPNVSSAAKHTARQDIMKTVRKK